MALLSALLLAGSGATAVDAAENREPSGLSGKALLWRIEREDGPTSHLFATLHLPNLRIPAAVEEALERSQSLTVEVDPSPKGRRLYRNRAMMDRPATLADLLAPKLFQRTLVLLDRYGVARRRAARLEPWAAFTRLSRPPAERPPLDQRLIGRARERGKPVHGLETMAELVSSLEGIPRKHQVALLREVVRDRKRLRSQWQALRAHYREGDLVGLLREVEEGTGETHHELMRRMRTERNRRMGARLRKRLAEGPTLVAVGALHLPGPSGLLRQLAEAGFELTPVSVPGTEISASPPSRRP